MIRRKAQTTIFVIIAVAIIAGGIIFFLIINNSDNKGISENLLPVFKYYEECIKDSSKQAISLAGSQGGYVGVPDYQPGSDYAPFSSQLNFLGFPVPYWYYVSANGLIKEQVPSMGDMEKGISDFIESDLDNCDFRDFESQGYEISLDKPTAKVRVQDKEVRVEISNNLKVSRDGESADKILHTVVINSKLGKFYNDALKIYQKQKDDAFLEDYSLDVLRYYAPVDGVEIECGPKIWGTRKVSDDLKKGLESNIAQIKFKGNYYDLKNKSDYYVVDQGVSEPVNLIYSKEWPTKIEINGKGVDGELMVAESVGTQAGLGIMGFCYVPYHFIYDVSFPVMIQLFDEEEIFQFPVAVIIDNNAKREVNFKDSQYPTSEDENFDFCAFYTQEVEVNLYDINLNKVDGDISYECFNQRCPLGKSEDGQFKGLAPACYNGFLQVKSNGYQDKSQLFSTNEENKADLILDKEYSIDVVLNMDGKNFEGGNAVISFIRGDGFTTTAVIPGISTINLTEGEYEVRTYVYSNTSVVIPATSKTQCQDVPNKGILGFLGGTKEECFDINIPETKMDYGLIGGGSSKDYFLGDSLARGRAIVNVKSLPTPNTIEQLQKNFELFDTRGVEISFE